MLQLIIAKKVVQYGGVASAFRCKTNINWCIQIEALGIKKKKNYFLKRNITGMIKNIIRSENVVGMDVKEAVKTLSRSNVTYSGSGSKVISQSPKANTRLEEGSTVRLMLGDGQFTKKDLDYLLREKKGVLWELENKKLLSILLGAENDYCLGCEGLKDYHTSQNSTTYSTSEIETTKNIYLTEQSTKEKEKPFIKDEGYVCALVNLHSKKAPDLSSEVLEVIPKFSRSKEKTNGTFDYISYDGTYGYVSHKYIEKLTNPYVEVDISDQTLYGYIKMVMIPAGIRSNR